MFYEIYRHEHEGEFPYVYCIKVFSCYVFYITTPPYLPCNDNDNNDNNINRV